MRTSPAIAVGVVALAALFAAPAGAETKVKFSHEMHLGLTPFECTDCHAKQANGAPKLTRTRCADCHDPMPPPWEIQPAAQRMDKPFPHPIHDKGVIKCTECHEAVARPQYTKGGPMVDPRKCAECHAGAGLRRAEANCRACHGVDQRKVPPSDHRGGWLKIHGEESRGRVFDDHGASCQLCHGADACVSCHKRRRPDSHTGLWRVRLHGSEAEWDRDSCRACHDAGTCVRCHRNTRPVNHDAAWRSTHGMAAAGIDNAGCAVCHSRPFCDSCHHK